MIIVIILRVSELDYQVCCYTISYELFECILPGLCVGGGTFEGRVEAGRYRGRQLTQHVNCGLLYKDFISHIVKK